MNFPCIKTAEDFTRLFGDEFWRAFAEAACRRHKISFQILMRAEHGENVVFLLDDRLVLKFFTPFKNGFRREKTALHFARGKSFIRFPEILFEGNFEGFDYLITNQFAGASMTRADWLKLSPKRQIEFAAHLAEGLRELHERADAETFRFDWKRFVRHQAATVFERQKQSGATREWLESLPRYLEENLNLLPSGCEEVFLHGDVHFGNLRLIEANGRLEINGLFDFADSLKGFREYEFVAVGVLMFQAQREIQREFFRAYGYLDRELDEEMRRRLMLLTILYEHSSLKRYAARLAPEAIRFTLERLEKSIWSFV